MSRNRYILECKEKEYESLMQAQDVEIDTFWNVKLRVSEMRGADFTVEIDTFWNVKNLPVL